MSSSPWQRRIERAEKLATEHAFAQEILGFFAAIARFQEDLYRRIEIAAPTSSDSGFNRPLWPGLVQHFPAFLALAEGYGPEVTAKAARRLQEESDDFFLASLNECWISDHNRNKQIENFFLRAFLQPYAELVRAHTRLDKPPHTPCLCPYCGGKPVAGVLRPLGDGGQRFLLCSFCLAEWEFRRIVCPGCGEEDNRKLPVYQAEGFGHIRVECCDNCKIYLKTVDLTKNGLAEPLVDEIASILLDLWAREHGYSKLQVNMMQL